jgi:hypothetical protein
MPSSRPKRGSARKKQYKGPLARPIYEEPVAGLLALPWRPGVKRVADQQAEKLLLLCDFYQIDRSDPQKWFLLAATLALNHVPGMRVISKPKRRRGRPPIWIAGRYNDLLRDVEDIRSKHDIDISTAIKMLVKQEKWKEFDQKSLETRHREARRAEAARRARREMLKSIKIYGPLDAELEAILSSLDGEPTK